MEEKHAIIEVLDNKKITNPISNVHPKEELIKYLEWEVIKDGINNISDPKAKLLILTLAYTGLRVSEVICIYKGDINFKDGFMEVKHLKSRKYERRIIPIRDELKNILFMATTSLNNLDRIFPYTRQYVYQLTQKYFKTNPHCFRHSFAVHFLRTSTDPMALELLRQLLGHSNILVTMEYLKVVPMQIKKALNDIPM